MECSVSSLMSLLSPGLAVGPSLSCGGALGLWWVGLPLEAGSELPNGRDLPQDMTNNMETAANQKASMSLPLFLRFACQAQSRSQQNLSVQTQDQRIRTTQTISPGTELLLRPSTDPDPVRDGNSAKAPGPQTEEVSPPTENTKATINDEALKMAATEKCILLKETERDESKMEDSTDNMTKTQRGKNKTQQTKTVFDNQKLEVFKMPDSENLLNRLKMEAAKQDTAPPTVRYSSRLALKPRQVHRLSSRVLPPLHKQGLMKTKPQKREVRSRGAEERGEEEEKGREGVATESTGGAKVQVKETPREGVTQDMTGVAIIVEAAGGRERRHTCLTCGKSFYQKSHLKKHEVTHSDQKPFSCDKCERSYSSKESYKAHQLFHQGKRPFLCPLCPKAYGLKRDLKEHLVLHSGLTPHVCPHCGRGFTRRPSLRAHQLNHCAKRPNTAGTKVQVQCSVCRKFLSNSGSLKNHMKIHTGERPHICQHCGKSFSQKGNLVAHVRAHSGERPYTCTDCGQGFGQRKELQRHQQVHSGTAFLCSCCGKVLRDAHTLRAHEALHSGAKAHSCNLCPKRYVSGTKLRRHLRSAHSSEKPFTCHCGSAYSLRQSLTRHQALHRLDETRAEAGRLFDRQIRGQACKIYKDFSTNPEVYRGEEGQIRDEGEQRKAEGMGEEGDAELLLIQEVAETIEINTG